MKPNLNSNDPMAQRVLGTWYLAEAYALGEQGQRLHDVYGRRPSGVIHYGADGRMIALEHLDHLFYRSTRNKLDDGKGNH